MAFNKTEFILRHLVVRTFAMDYYLQCNKHCEENINFQDKKHYTIKVYSVTAKYPIFLGIYIIRSLDVRRQKMLPVLLSVLSVDEVKHN